VSATPGNNITCSDYASYLSLQQIHHPSLLKRLICRVKPEVLKRVGQAITTLPEGFKPHRAVKKIFEQRAAMIESGEGIDWAVAEALAFAALIVEGNHVRLSGQDVERGTFSHRHSVLHDQETGAKYCPLDHVVMNQNEELFTVSNR
jgi:2-oxoglutarate dehydrogenase E1 component